MKMKRFNEEVYTGSPKVYLSSLREFDELERCLRYSDLKKFMVCACLILAGRLFQTSGALLVNESMPGREEGQNGRREFPLPLVWWECSVKLSLVHRERSRFLNTSSHDNSKLECPNGGNFCLPIRPGDTAHCPPPHRTEAITQRSGHERYRCCSCILKVRLNDCQVEKTASGRRKLMYVSSENADLLANFRYDRVDLGWPGELIVHNNTQETHFCHHVHWSSAK